MIRLLLLNQRHFFINKKYAIPKFDMNTQERRLLPIEEAFISQGRGDYFLRFKRRILPMFTNRGLYFQKNGAMCFLW